MSQTSGSSIWTVGIRPFRIRRFDGMKVRIIVEGPSERAYMQRLISFLGSDMPLDEDEFSPRLIFYPRVTNNNIGGGSYSLVRKDLCQRGLLRWIHCGIYAITLLMPRWHGFLPNILRLPRQRFLFGFQAFCVESTLRNFHGRSNDNSSSNGGRDRY